jgi:peptide/nickel transport system permease protein
MVGSVLARAVNARRPEQSWRSAQMSLTAGSFADRTLAAIMVCWGVTFATFAAINVLPGDAAQALLGENATQTDIQVLTARLKLNEPFFERYFNWLADAVRGNLGTSLASGQHVSSILSDRMPVSFELVLLAMIVSLTLAVPVAMLSARQPGGMIDRLSLVVSTVGISVAPFVLALALIFVFAVELNWFPAIGFVPIGQSLAGNLRSLTLPACALALPLFSAYNRLLRADLVDQLRGEDYVLTARAKGASPWQVLCRHALRNSLVGLLTLVGLNLGTLIGATVIIEQVFAVPGIGATLVQAINDRDVPVVEGTVLVFGLLVVAANLLTDLANSRLDPRIRYGFSGH